MQKHLGFSDNEYKNIGVKLNDDEKILESADLVAQLRIFHQKIFFT